MNHKVDEWIQEIAQLTTPQRVHICDGTDEEYRALCQEMVKSQTFISLNPHLRPDSYLARSHPDDVARTESRTFICSQNKQEAGPTNNWKDPSEMRAMLRTLFKGCMKGRTLYVIPFSMGPIDSPFSKIGIEITDSPYVVCSTRIMARMGSKVLKKLGDGPFVPCVHSVGMPLVEGQNDVPWPCNPKNVYIVHYPETKEIWSFGSGYGGNALLGKKCLALRIASTMARDEGWLAEHMLIAGMTNPQGEKKYFAAAFPSACGKTNLAMLQATLPGWKIEMVGDDIAWIRQGADGRLYAINPETGVFGVAPGTSMKSNPNAFKAIEKKTLFTNVALTPEMDVWWEGMTETPPQQAWDWHGRPWSPHSKEKAAQPNSRFTFRADQLSSIDEAWQNPEGVPLSAIIFGGRRSSTVPLVREAVDWKQGVFFGASVSSETTAAAVGVVGQLRHDPFAMLPFCGYHMGDYFAHWLSIGKKGDPKKLPRIYYVNWFKKGSQGQWLWPGFGDNIRVLKWIFERTSGSMNAEKTPIGNIPAQGALDLSGLQLSQDSLKQLFEIDRQEWKREVESLKKYFALFGPQLPLELKQELETLENQLLK